MSKRTQEYRMEHPEENYAQEIKNKNKGRRVANIFSGLSRQRHFWEVLGMTPAFAAAYVASLSTTLNSMFGAETEELKAEFNSAAVKLVGQSALWTILYTFITGVLIVILSTILINGFVYGKKMAKVGFSSTINQAMKDTIAYVILCFILYIFNMVAYFIAIYAFKVTFSAQTIYFITTITYFVIYVLAMFIAMIARHATFKSFLATIGYVFVAFLFAVLSGWLFVIFPSNIRVLGCASSALILAIVRFAIALVEKYWENKAKADAEAKDKKLPTVEEK